MDYFFISAEVGFKFRYPDIEQALKNIMLD